MHMSQEEQQEVCNRYQQSNAALHAWEQHALVVFAEEVLKLLWVESALCVKGL